MKHWNYVSTQFQLTLEVFCISCIQMSLIESVVRQLKSKTRLYFFPANAHIYFIWTLLLRKRF